jgi:hypothetical protein
MRVFGATFVASFVFINLCGVGQSEPLAVQTNAVNLHTEDDQIRRVGRLIFQGGLELASSDPRFGGLSGLVVSLDGTRLSAVTDQGDWVFFKPILSSTGQLRGLAGAQIGDLRDLDGKPLRGKRRSDAESLVSVDDGIAISFERRHRLWIYRGMPNPLSFRPTEIALPALTRKMPRNKGLEALARLRDGRLIAIAENYPRHAPFTQGWMLHKKRWHRFRYRRRARFLPTGAVTTPDGDLLVLERRFSYIGGIGTRLVAISSTQLIPGADIRGRELARLEHPLITENFEGIAAFRNAVGKTVLYLISDDNFGLLQRTILLKFVLGP